MDRCRRRRARQSTPPERNRSSARWSRSGSRGRPAHPRGRTNRRGMWRRNRVGKGRCTAPHTKACSVRLTGRSRSSKERHWMRARQQGTGVGTPLENKGSGNSLAARRLRFARQPRAANRPSCHRGDNKRRGRDRRTGPFRRRQRDGSDPPCRPLPCKAHPDSKCWRAPTRPRKAARWCRTGRSRSRGSRCWSIPTRRHPHTRRRKPTEASPKRRATSSTSDNYRPPSLP